MYRARDLKLQRDVAVKFLPDDVAGDAERRQRFEREARAVAALKHPGIVTIHSVDDVDGRVFLTNGAGAREAAHRPDPARRPAGRPPPGDRRAAHRRGERRLGRTVASTIGTAAPAPSGARPPSSTGALSTAYTHATGLAQSSVAPAAPAARGWPHLSRLVTLPASQPRLTPGKAPGRPARLTPGSGRHRGGKKVTGRAGIWVRHLTTGEAAAFHADDQFNAASVIKIPVAVLAMQMAERGQLSLDERITITKADVRGGSGVFRHHDPGLPPTFRDVLMQMSATSDNTATDLAIRSVGGVEHLHRRGRLRAGDAPGADDGRT